ncbi:MAG: hypothetical protein K8U57_34580 [Planctomycetes bacterium]|nr:hypothetical protein [Planctomycetota bacterium]
MAPVRAVWRAAKSSVDHDVFYNPVHACDVPHPAPIQHVFGVGHLRELPFWTTHDILYVFHRLRC